MPQTDSYDTIIVGAGPAGATAAYILATRGLKVLIIDKKTFPRPKLCGGLLTWKSLFITRQIFGVSPASMRSAGILHFQSDRYAVRSKRKQSFCGRLDFPFHFVDRRSYDDFWLDYAKQAGAEVRLGRKVVQIDEQCQFVTTEDGCTYRGRFILAADGATSRLRNILAKRGQIGHRWRGSLAVGMEVMIPRRAGRRWEDFPAIFYGFIPWGYAWSFPGLETQTYGMAALSSRSGKKIKSRFSEFLASQSIEPAASRHIASHCLPYGNYARRPGSRRLLLLGDACGLADPLLGEGIYYAHRSAQLAARAVLSAIQNPDSLVPSYGRLLKENIFPELKYAALGRRIAFSLPKSWYYYFFLFMLKGNQRIVEETIQGKRSFRWFRPIDHGTDGDSVRSRFSGEAPGALRPSRESNRDS